jgi:DNA-binding response OmpR family regulator
MFRILTADNDKAYRRRLQQLLKQAGYPTVQASNGDEILKTIDTEYVDLLILGTNLEDIDVCEFAGQLSATHSDMLIMMMAQKNDLEELKRGYLAGADEYLTKSIDDEELLLRIRALLKRAGKSYKKQLVIGEVVLDANSMTVTRGEERHTLPKKEFWLLYKLLSYPGNIFTRTQLMDEIWGLTTESAQSTLNVHVNRLRNKFRNYPEFELKAVRGIGYKAEVYSQVS